MSKAQAATALTSEPATPAKNRPVSKVRAGAIVGTLWQNSGKNGTFYSVTFERRYKEAGQWKSASSFGRGDLLELSRAASKAYDAIDDLEAESSDN